MIIASTGSTITTDHENPNTSPDKSGAGEASTSDAVYEIIDDNETVVGTCTSPQGLARIADGDRRHVGVTVVLAVTDRRILFVAAGDGSDAGSLAYGDLVSIDVEGDGILVLGDRDGVRWEFPLLAADPEAVEAVAPDLRWIGELRGRLVACRTEVERAAGEMRDCASTGEWAAAERAYASVRDTLDRLIVAVQWTEPVPDEVLAPELTDIERTLERAYARLQVARAESELDLARQLAAGGEYARTRTVLEDARRYYERAAGRADAVERGDAFRFGEQRELRSALDRLAWNMEAVAAEPVRAAHEARVQAENADAPETAVEHWETALCRYRDLLDLEWEDGEFEFAGDREALRSALDAVAGRLLACRCALAHEHWERGVEREAAGETAEAVDRCETALDHLDRAAELATEYRPADREDVEWRRAYVARALRRIREGDADAGTADARNLADIDTHHEITLDTAVEGADGDSANGTLGNGRDDAPPDEGEPPVRGPRDGESGLTEAIRRTDATEN